MMHYKIRNINTFSEELIAKTYEEMTEGRKIRYDRYKFKEDKARMLCAEALLKELVFEITGVNPFDIVVDNKENGAPFVAVDDREIFASISHSGDYVAVAISETPVGIDIEARDRISTSLIERIATEEEKKYIDYDSQKESLSNEELKRFLQIWTAKEAYVKLTEEGIKAGMKKINTIPFLFGKGEMEYIGESNGEYTFSLLVSKKI